MRKQFWIARILSLESELDGYYSQGVSLFESRSARMCLIDLNSRWEQAVRELFLFYAARNDTGLMYPRRSHKNTIITAYLKNAGLKKELNWLVPTDVIRFSQQLALPEHKYVLPILGKTPWLLDDMRHYRNFIAHSSEESARKLDAKSSPLSVPKMKKFPFEMTKGIPRYKLWVLEMSRLYKMLPS